MANMRDIRRRIKSVKSTQQITKAMKMVAAAKLRKSQAALDAMRPYADKNQEILGNLLGCLLYTSRDSGDVSNLLPACWVWFYRCLSILTSCPGSRSSGCH